jgi:hypothetical protein
MRIWSDSYATYIYIVHVVVRTYYTHAGAAEAAAGDPTTAATTTMASSNAAVAKHNTSPPPAAAAADDEQESSKVLLKFCAAYTCVFHGGSQPVPCYCCLKRPMEACFPTLEQLVVCFSVFKYCIDERCASS